MKLIQIFIEDKEMDKCPVCKKFTIMKSRGYLHIDYNTCFTWEYSCTNCNAKFVEEKK